MPYADLFVFLHFQRSKHLKLFPGWPRLHTQGEELLAEKIGTSGFDLSFIVKI